MTRRRMLVAAVIAFAVVWAAQLVAILSLDTVTFRGSVVVVAATSSGDPCAAGARRDIHPGTAVRLRSTSGRLVVSTQLRVGRPARDGRRCVYRFTLRNVPASAVARSYVVAVAGEGRRAATPAQLTRGFDIVLG